MIYGAGDLKERVEVLELAAVEGGWAWESVRRTWAEAELTDRTNLFSKVGIGARDVRLVLRRQNLTLHNALRWKGQHLFLTSIVENIPGWLDVQAALVEPAACRGNVHRGENGPTFPGVLTEKYLRHEQDHPMATTTVCYVLVTPKAVEIEPKGLVEAGGTRYVVQVAHTLDGWKNEYEILRKGDK